jgi:ketosteroid isomerase-like protein
MPGNPMEVVSATYAAWDAGDWGLEYFHPELEWELTGKGALDQTGTNRGRDAFFDFMRRFWAAWRPGAKWEIEERQPFGDEQVLVHGRLRVVGRSSGLETSVTIYHVWTVRDGLMVRFLGCDDRATAMKAVGS